MQEYYQLLRATSRTFAVGIEALPTPLRDAVTIAYLVLRVSDYFEDSPTLPDERKRKGLQLWAELVEDAGEQSLSSDRIAGVRAAVAPEDRDLPDYGAALEAEAILEGLSTLEPTLRNPIRVHTVATTRGMARWIARGPDFPHEQAMDDYMFEVAGRVGLLLTDLFAGHSPGIRRRRRELEQNAVSFGLGLQTVNVIRGLHEDPRRGWSFVPRSVLGATADGEAGFVDPRVLPPDDQRRILDFLTAKAARHVGDALSYCRALPRAARGIRLFCIIPAMLASRTLQISGGNLQVFRRSVKVSRSEVRRIALTARLFWFSNAWLAREEKALRRLVPADSRTTSPV